MKHPVAANKIFALIDCNNFFVSCERLFRPDLEGKPVVVLSSNDGCIVARSNEAKLLGIPMGAPVFQWRQVLRQNNIQMFSANFETYGDISKRITALLASITPRIEVYSVDESFLDLSSLPIRDYAAWGRTVRATILKNIGVPVSIGIAPSKTLAKLASELAKKDETQQGAVSLVDVPAGEMLGALANTPIQDIWGVGRHLAPKLRAEGITNAAALASMRPAQAGQLMGVHGRQLVAELNGTACHLLEIGKDAAQSIMRSRTFGEDTAAAHVLESAIATLAAQAAFRLRRDHLLAQGVGFFTSTNRHKPGYRRWVRQMHPAQPLNDSGRIIALLVAALGQVYSPAQRYHRLGVFLYDLIPEQALQTDLLGAISPETHDRNQARMRALDSINARHGRGTLRYAAEDLGKTWQPKQHIRSPRYLTNWAEIPEAYIKK